MPTQEEIREAVARARGIKAAAVANGRAFESVANKTVALYEALPGLAGVGEVEALDWIEDFLTGGRIR